MRFSSFLLCFVLLLSLQIASADTQTSIIGNWTRPLNNTDVGPFCCIPTSILIQSNGTDRYLANFEFPGFLEKDFNVKCFSLFISLTGKGNMTLIKYSSESNNSYVGAGLFGKVIYDFEVQSNPSPSLNVKLNSLDPDNQCDFTMESKDGNRLFISNVKVSYF